MNYPPRKNFIFGEPCDDCGCNTRYKISLECVACKMSDAAPVAVAYRRLDNFEKKMRGVWYG